MNEVVNQVVSMFLNNQGYNKNAEESIATTERLKKSLDFSEVQDGFGAITRNARGVDFGPLSDAIGNVGQKFSVMEQLAIGALRRIGDRIESTAERMVKTFTTDNIAAGFNKFTEKTQSVATLVAQGYALEEVNTQLERLNWFSDETSYSFTDMVNNISKFTATGEKLEPSVNAMEGIATWAALSGQNPTTASRAMYQLAQAMSKGALKYDDYKSIQIANMDTQEFRKTALETAVALKKVQKVGKDTYKVLATGKTFSFAEMFSSEGLSREKWFDKDVMMGTFQKYSAAVDQIYQYAQENGLTAAQAMEALGDSVDEFGLKAFKAAQEARSWHDVVEAIKDAVGSGWMTTFENIFGDYKEAAAFWTELSNKLYEIFATGGEIRNEMLSSWKEMGGRDDFVQSVWNLMDALISMVNVVKDGFHDIFPPMTAERLKGFTENMLSFTEKIKNFFSGDVRGLHFGDFLAQSLPPLKKTTELLGPAGKKLQTLSDISEGLSRGALKDLADQGKKLPPLLDESETALGRLRRTLNGVFAIFDIGKQLIGAVVAAFKPLAQGTGDLAYDILGVTASWGDWLKNLADSIRLNETFAKVTEVLTKIINGIRWVVNELTGDFLSVNEAIVSFWEGGGGLSGVFEVAFDKIIAGVKFVLKAFSKLTGIDLGLDAFGNNEFIQSLRDIRNEVVDFVYNLTEKGKVIGEVFKTVFGGGSVKQLYNSLTNRQVDILDLFGGTDAAQTVETLVKRVSTFKDVLTTIWDVVKEIGSRIGKVVKSTWNFLTTFLSINETMVSFAEGGGGITGVIEVIMDKLAEVARFVFNIIRDITGIDLTKIGGVVVSLIQNVRNGLTTVISKIQEKFQMPGFDFFGQVLEGIKNVLSKIKDFIFGVNSAAGGFKSNGLVDFLGKIFDAIINIGTTLASGIGTVIVKFFDGLANLDFSAVLDVIKTIIAGKLTSAISGLAGAFTGITDLFENINGLFKGSGGLDVTGIHKLSEALLLLAISMLILSAIDPLSLTAGLYAITGMLTALSDTFKKMMKAASGFKVKLINAISRAILKIAAAVLIMAIAIVVLGKQPIDNLAKGLVAVIAMLGALVGTMYLLSKYTIKDPKKIESLGKALIKISVAILIMSIAVKKLGKMKLGDLAKGLGAIVIMLGALVGAMFLLSKYTIKDPKKIKQLGNTLIKIAVAMVILSIAVKKLGTMDLADLAKGVVAVVVLLAAMAGAAILLSQFASPGKIAGASAALIVLGIALGLIAGIVKTLGKLPIETLGKGLLGLIVVFAIMAVAMAAMSSDALAPGKIAAISASMILLGVAMLLLATGVAMLGSLDMATLLQGILGLGTVLLVLAAAAYVIQSLGVTLTLLTMGVALALIGVSVFLVATGITLLAVALDLLAISGTAGAAALVAMLGILIVGILELIPSIIEVLTALIVAILDMIIEVTPKLVEAVVVVVGAILDGLIELVPKIVETVLVLVTAVLQSIHDHAYEIVSLCIQILLDILKAIRDNLPEVVNTVIDIIVAFVDTVAANLERVIQAGMNLFLSFIEGITSALQNNRERVENDVRELIRGIIDMVFAVLTGSIEGIKDAARDIMDSGFITGIKEKINKAKVAIKEFVDKIIEKIKTFVTDFKTAAKDTIEGFIQGIKDKISDAVEGIKNFGSKILNGLKGILGISSPSKITRGYGQYMDEGLMLGMEDLSSAVVSSAEGVGGGAMDALAAAVAGANDLIENDMDDPVITPVIDLSKIQNGVESARSLFDGDFTFGGSATLQGVALGSAVQSSNPADFGFTPNVSNMNYGGNTFYITGDNPKDIADQVASILQLRTERAERAWA